MLIEKVAKDHIEKATNEPIEKAAHEYIEQAIKKYIDAKNELGETALYLAIKKRYPEIAKILLRKNAKIDYVDRDDNTLLHLSSMYGLIEIVDMLTKKATREYMNAKNKYGHTALSLAIIEKHEEAAKILIDKGTDIDSVNKNNNTPLHLASMHGLVEIVNRLVEKVTREYTKEVAREYIDAKNEQGETALSLAIIKGHQEIAEMLINEGAGIHFVDENGNTLLHFASKNGLVKIAEMLIEKVTNEYIEKAIKEHIEKDAHEHIEQAIKLSLIHI